jgi:hypothetical protein
MEVAEITPPTREAATLAETEIGGGVETNVLETGVWRSRG